MGEKAPEFLKLARSRRRELKPAQLTPEGDCPAAGQALHKDWLTPKPKPPLETPCIDVCEMDGASGLCLGCGRTLDEIARWAEMSPVERRAIMAILPARKARSETVKG